MKSKKRKHRGVLSKTAHERAKAARRRRYKLNPEKEQVQQQGYRAANAAKVKTKQDEWHAANRARHRATSLAYAKANPDLVRRKAAERHAKDPGKKRAQARQWQKDNPDKVRANIENRRARNIGAEGRYTSDDAAAIRKIQKNRCAYCRCKLGRGGHLDHIKALSKGGSNWPRNLQWLCAPCNISKNARDALEFARSRGFLL